MKEHFLTSMLPLHLSTNLSILISKSSESSKGLCVITTPLLNSSRGRRRSAVLWPLDNFTSDPQRSWNRSLSCLTIGSAALKSTTNKITKHYKKTIDVNLWKLFLVQRILNISVPCKIPYVILVIDNKCNCLLVYI